MELHLALHLLVEGGPVGTTRAGGGRRRRCRGGVGIISRRLVLTTSIGPRAAGAAHAGGAAPPGKVRRGVDGGAGSMTLTLTVALARTLRLSRRVSLVHGIREEGRPGGRLGSLKRMSMILVSLLMSLMSTSSRVTAGIIANVMLTTQLLLLTTVLLHVLGGHVMIDDITRNSGPVLLRSGSRLRPRPGGRRPQGLLLGQPPSGTHLHLASVLLQSMVLLITHNQQLRQFCDMYVLFVQDPRLG